MFSRTRRKRPSGSWPASRSRSAPKAVNDFLYLYAAIRHLLYPRRPDIYVAADQFIYYKPNDPTVKVAPDVWVCYGVSKEPERDVFRTWEEDATPGFVAEVSSETSRETDRRWIYSQELDLWFGREPDQLVRVYTPDGQPVANFAEVYATAELETRLRQHFQEEAQALQAEVERLRAELARLRGE